MANYVMRRFLYMAGLLFVVSVTSFIIIQLPPGDWLTAYAAQLRVTGQQIDEAQLASLKKQYGLDLPLVSQYLRWIKNMFRGDFGRSFSYNEPVSTLLRQRLPLTILLSLFTVVITYAIAIPIGIFGATHQYSVLDYAFTVVGFIGLAMPGFLFALILMYFSYKYLGLSVGGLFSANYIGAPWSAAKFLDMLKHLPIPLLVISTAGTASLIRVMRGCLLDEIKKQYVTTARAKGVPERTLLLRYPVRVALNPIISTIGWVLPAIASGETIVSIVLNLPTTGPLLYQALLSQDMYLAGSIVMFLSSLTIVGTFISDVLLCVVDPRIQFER